MSDLPAEKVAVTIPGFHDTPARYARLMEAIEKDSHGRVAEVQEEIDFIKSRENITGVLLDHLKAGRQTERVTWVEIARARLPLFSRETESSSWLELLADLNY